MSDRDLVQDLANIQRRGAAIAATKKPRWSTEELSAALGQVAVGGRVTTNSYECAYRASLRAGQPLPCKSVFVIRYGGWNAAVEALGFQHGDARRTYERMSDDRLASDVAHVIAILRALEGDDEPEQHGEAA